MPTVHREQGFRVVIYPNDHLPSHVHVQKGGGEARINLGDAHSLPSLMTILGDMSNKDVAKALNIVKAHQVKLLTRWREIHGCS